MYTRTLKVGQYVYMANDVEGKGGSVVKVSPSGVEVLTGDGLLRLRFDANGRELDESRRERLGFGPSPGDKFRTTLWEIAPEFRPLELLTEEEWFDRQ